MSGGNESCTLLVAVPPKQSLPTAAELCAELEAPEPARKTAALQVRARARPPFSVSPPRRPRRRALDARALRPSLPCPPARARARPALPQRAVLLLLAGTGSDADAASAPRTLMAGEWKDAAPAPNAEGARRGALRARASRPRVATPTPPAHCALSLLPASLQ